MKKNKRNAPPPTPAAPPAPPRPLLGKKSLTYIAAGILTLIVGYTVLSFADSRAQNLPGKLSPFLILGGYILIGVGLFVNSKPAGN